MAIESDHTPRMFDSSSDQEAEERREVTSCLSGGTGGGRGGERGGVTSCMKDLCKVKIVVVVEYSVLCLAFIG